MQGPAVKKKGNLKRPAISPRAILTMGFLESRQEGMLSWLGWPPGSAGHLEIMHMI